jgi:membrane-associated protease RseP (regulator of RpoE activity)
MSDPTPPVAYSYDLVPPLEAYIITPPRRHYWINVLLLLATTFSTLLVGARLEFAFQHGRAAFPENLGLLRLFPVEWLISHPSRLLLGIPFCATLMVILLAHEMGHYLCCRYYGVYATLPFFIPAPTLIGTMGAFIRIKSPIRSRTALFDIGIAGPIAGFTVASITLCFALIFSRPHAGSGADDAVLFGYPIMFDLVRWVLVHLGFSGLAAIPLQPAYLHPTAIAAWVGMFATALNLLPGGQLDGGHIVYAVFPRLHRWASRLTVLALLFASWWWTGWLIWALLLRLSGMRHPRVPIEPELAPGRRSLFVLAVLILILTFMLAPLQGGGLPDVLSLVRDLLH